ncbi:IclR family transcriptional regulator [Streptomyces niger]|uniref:IclR family transcriptional regulator n=1 Tax=Streptomyces niger TaxID=66373 RepID=UPI00069AB66D|nr:IclR family transcriptional regulator C-terminal domain-containing protein [Streptomyces niger]
MVIANDASTAHPTLIGSVQRALRLLEAVAAHPRGAPAKQLARETGYPLPTTYHLLRTLTHEGYLQRENGVFVLGEAAELIGRAGARRRRQAQITDALSDMGREVGAAVYFAVYRAGEVEVLAVSDDPDRPPVAEWVDFRTTAHAHAIGQCLLAQLDEEARKDHLARYQVQSLTPHSVRSEDHLLHRLDTVRKSQLAVEREEYAVGTVCAAIPIHVGSAAATVALSLPAGEADRLPSVTEKVQRMAESTLMTLAFSISI